jgi:hypothetical protein
VNHAGIYMELLDTGKLYFTIEEWFGGVCVDKQIFGELAGLLCDFLSIARFCQVSERANSLSKIEIHTPLKKEISF